jgi:hypothetical protein
MSSDYGKCTLFHKHDHIDNYLVNGKINDIEYYYCSTARKYDFMCGKEGKFYEKK